MGAQAPGTAYVGPPLPPEVLSELAPYVVFAEKLGRLAIHLETGGSRIQCVKVALLGNLILCKLVDEPGMIGKVGNIVGESNLNVSFMTVGRTVKRKLAIRAIGVDRRRTDKDTQKKIGEVTAIEEFVFLTTIVQRSNIAVW
ncbi:hypothetical protein FXO38_33298 [Capsicum annuum]|nr:hypothetical protein FXO38_33298 [Capsicum annuum]